jgi:hypothetical protein
MSMRRLTLPLPRASLGLCIASRPGELMRRGRAKWRAWRGEDKCLRALVEVGDDQLSDLSEAGQQLRREARRQRAPQRWARGART